jgi:hypothetical protein
MSPDVKCSAVQCSVQLVERQVAAPVACPANQDTAATHLRGAGRILLCWVTSTTVSAAAKRKDKKAEGGRIFTLADFACFGVRCYQVEHRQSPQSATLKRRRTWVRMRKTAREYTSSRLALIQTRQIMLFSSSR